MLTNDYGQPLCPDCGGPALALRVQELYVAVPFTMRNGEPSFALCDGQRDKKKVTDVYCLACGWKASNPDAVLYPDPMLR